MKQMVPALMLAIFVFGCSYEPAPTSAAGDMKPIGKPIGDMPAFELANVTGGQLKSVDLKGKVAVIDMWATWCAPCIKEIPMLNELHTQYMDDDGVEVLAITVESGTSEEIKPYVEEFKMNYPVLAGNDEIAEGFGGILGYPTTFIIGKDGKIYKRMLGAVKDKKALIEKEVAALKGTT